MRTSKLWFLGLGFALAACSRGGGDPTANGSAETATFYVQPPAGGDADETTDGKNFANLPKDRKFNFTACLADVAVQQPVVGAVMQVEGGINVEVRSKDGATDGKGCFYWSERIPFDLTKQETFYEIKRTLRAVTQQQGYVELRLGIDPWQKGAAAVRDLTVSGAPRTLPFNQINQPSARVDDNVGFVVEAVETNLEIVALEPRKKRPGHSDEIAGQLRVIFQPQLRRPSIDGESYVMETIRGGDYNVTARIVTRAGGQELPFTDELNVSPARYAQGGVRAEGQVHLLRKIRRDAELELDFTAEPRGDNQRFGRVHGRVPLGTLAGFRTNKTGPLTLTRESATAGQALAAAKRAPDNFEFELGKVSVDQMVVKELDSTGRPRLLEMRFVATPYSGVTHGGIFKEPFEIAWAMNGESGKISKPVETDEQKGELRWWQTVPIDFYRKQEPPKMQFALRSLNKIYGPRPVHRNVYLDLWAYESPGAVAMDEEFVGPPRASVLDAAGNSEMVISYSMFNFLSRDFRIDENLMLSTTRTYRLELEPTIRRMTRDKGWSAPVSVGNGRYLVRFLIESVDKEPQIIDAVTENMEARNGKISATVMFTLDDVRYAAVRTNLTVQVLPLEPDTSLVSTPYIGTFDMVGGFVVRFEPRKDHVDIGPRMEAFLKNRNAGRHAGPEFYAEAKGFEILRKPQMKELGFTDQQLAGVASWGENHGLENFCSFFFGKPGWNPLADANSCLRAPKDYIITSNTQHMHKLNDQHQAAPPDALQLGIQAGISYSMSEGDSFSHGTSIKADADIGLKGTVKIPPSRLGRLGEWLAGADNKGKSIEAINGGVSTGIGYGWSWSHSTDNSNSKSRGADVSKSIRVDDISFLIDADVDECTLFSAPNATAPRKKTFMFCAEQPARKRFLEHYYHIFQEARPGPIQDDGARLEDRPLIALVRGTPYYEEFRQMLMDPNVTLNLNKDDLPVPYYMWKQLEKRSDGFFPGLLTEPSPKVKK